MTAHTEQDLHSYCHPVGICRNAQCFGLAGIVGQQFRIILAYDMSKILSYLAVG